MRIRTLVLPLFALIAIAVPVRADVVTQFADLTYNVGGKRWDFLTDTFVGGSIHITSKGITKKLTKLKLQGSSHQCDITYDNDSKVIGGNGDFYAVFKLSKCD